MSTEQRVNGIVCRWLKTRLTGVASVVSVSGSGTDWAGSTGEGFHSEFSVSVIYRDTAGRDVFFSVEGDDMESLWTWVLNAAASGGDE